MISTQDIRECLKKDFTSLADGSRYLGFHDPACGLTPCGSWRHSRMTYRYSRATIPSLKAWVISISLGFQPVLDKPFQRHHMLCLAELNIESRIIPDVESAYGSRVFSDGVSTISFEAMELF